MPRYTATMGLALLVLLAVSMKKGKEKEKIIALTRKKVTETQEDDKLHILSQ